MRLALKTLSIEIFSGRTWNKYEGKDVFCSEIEDNEEMGTENSLKIPLSPKLVVAHDGEQIDYIIPTISWTARKGPPQMLLFVHVLVSSYYTVKIFYEFLGTWNKMSILFMITSCFFHLMVATISVEVNMKLHYFCAGFGYFFLTAGSSLGIVDLWEQLLTSTKIVACTGISMYAVFATFGTMVEKLAILEWLANIIYGLMPLMMALTMNPTDPFFP